MKEGGNSRKGMVKAQLRSGILSLKEGLRSDFSVIRRCFSVRTFFAFFFGVLLLGACWYLYVAPLVYAVRFLHWYDYLPQLFFGIIGFLASNFLIFMLSVHTAAGKGPEGGQDAYTALAAALRETGEGRKKKIAVALCLYVAIWAAGFVALGFFIRDEVRYRNYEEVPAVVEMIFQYDDDGYTLRYGYDIDGVHYTYTGNSKFSGSAAPVKGDVFYIKVDPADPEKIFLQNESPALVFAAFLLSTGLLLVLFELHAVGKCPLPFCLTVAMWLIPAVAFVAMYAFTPASQLIAMLARNQALQIVLLFVYGGALECVCGILSLGKKTCLEKRKKLRS